jgi:hypothetical protein
MKNHEKVFDIPISKGFMEHQTLELENMVHFGRFCHYQWLRRVKFIYILILSQFSIGLESFSKVYHTSIAIIPPPGLVHDKLMETRIGLDMKITVSCFLI